MKLIALFIFSMNLALATTTTKTTKTTTTTTTATATATTQKILEIPLKTIDGKKTNLKSLAENKKAFLIVNTASKCGYTSQYDGLEKLHNEYGPKGLVVLGFPSNDFMGQEPGKNEEIAKFCKTKYGVSFTMFQKNSVKGKKIQPLYTELLKLGLNPGAAKGSEGAGEEVSWNFNKFLITSDGHLLGRFDSGVKPDDKELVEAITKALK